MRKVLHLRSSGQLLGAERVVLELAKYLPDFGYQPIIGIPIEKNQPPSEFAATAEKSGFQVAKFPINGAFDTRALKSIKRFALENNIDVIHSHGYREDFYAVFARTQAKLVATNHLWKRTTFKLKLYAGLDAFLLRRFKSIIAVSQAVKNDMCHTGIKENIIHLVANGIDPTTFSEPNPKDKALDSLKLPSKKIIVGTLSSLSSEKGLNFIIEAIAQAKHQVPNIHLLIVGSGEEQHNLEAQVVQLNLQDTVTFAGRRSDINNIFSAIDIFALPSLNEGLPMALLEAMAAAKAVIATDVGDVATAVNGEVGILVDSGNADLLSDAIVKLSSNPKLIQQYGSNARQRILSSFSSCSMAQTYAAIYDNVLKV